MQTPIWQNSYSHTIFLLRNFFLFFFFQKENFLIFSSPTFQKTKVHIEDIAIKIRIYHSASLNPNKVNQF